MRALCNLSSFTFMVPYSSIDTVLKYMSCWCMAVPVVHDSGVAHSTNRKSSLHDVTKMHADAADGPDV